MNHEEIAVIAEAIEHAFVETGFKLKRRKRTKTYINLDFEMKSSNNEFWITYPSELYGHDILLAIGESGANNTIAPYFKYITPKLANPNFTDELIKIAKDIISIFEITKGK